MSAAVIMVKRGSGLLQNCQIQIISFPVIFLWQSARSHCFSVAVHQRIGEMEMKIFSSLIYKDPICDPLKSGDEVKIVIINNCNIYLQ